MAQSYCEVTEEWIAFSTRSTRITQEAAADAIRPVMQEVARVAAQIAPWTDETGETRASFVAWTSEDAQPDLYTRPSAPSREGEVRGYVSREVTDHGKYLAMMERGEIGGWGNPPPVQSWNPAAYGYRTAEEVAMSRLENWVTDQVRDRFYQEFGRKMGSFRFNA